MEKKNIFIDCEDNKIYRTSLSVEQLKSAAARLRNTEATDAESKERETCIAEIKTFVKKHGLEDLPELVKRTLLTEAFIESTMFVKKDSPELSYQEIIPGGIIAMTTLEMMGIKLP